MIILTLFLFFKNKDYLIILEIFLIFFEVITNFLNLLYIYIYIYINLMHTRGCYMERVKHMALGCSKE